MLSTTANRLSKQTSGVFLLHLLSGLGNVVCQVWLFQVVLFPEFTRLNLSLSLLLYYLGIGNNFLEEFHIPVCLTTGFSNILMLI